MNVVEYGDVVLYVLESGDVRPAQVVEVWDGKASYPLGTVNLSVFLDGGNDRGRDSGIDDDMLLWATSVHFNLDKEPGTWHYREKDVQYTPYTDPSFGWAGVLRKPDGTVVAFVTPEGQMGFTREDIPSP